MSENFRDFELSGWQAVASPYHDYFGKLTRQTIGPLLKETGVKSADKVLDVASGPGYVASAAAELGAEVTGIDFSAVMVETARRHYKSIQFIEGDAQSLPFEENTFDRVLMNFGILHLDCPETAIEEAFRVLKPGGCYAFTAWATQDKACAFGIVLESIEKNGEMQVGLPAGPPFFRFSDAVEAMRVLTEAGFENTFTRDIPMLWQLSCEDDFFEAFYRGTPRTGGLLRAQSDINLNRIKSDIARKLKEFKRGDQFEIPMASVLTSGRKPA